MFVTERLMTRLTRRPHSLLCVFAENCSVTDVENHDAETRHGGVIMFRVGRGTSCYIVPRQHRGLVLEMRWMIVALTKTIF